MPIAPRPRHSTQQTRADQVAEEGREAGNATRPPIRRLVVLAPAEARAGLAEVGPEGVELVGAANLPDVLLHLRTIADGLLADPGALDGDLRGLDDVRRKHPYLPIILLVGADGTDGAEAAIGETVDDYLVLDRDRPDLLPRLVRRARERRGLHRTVRQQHQLSARLAKVAERTDNGVIITDPAGKIQWINNGFTRLSGYTISDLAGSLPFSVLPSPHGDPTAVEAFRRALAAERRLRRELLLRSQPGADFWVNCDLEPLRNDAGNAIGFLIMALDISELKRREQDLRLSEERLKLALWGTEDGLWDWNLADDGFYASESWFTILGHEPRIGTGVETWKSLIHPEERAEVERRLADHLDGRDTVFEMEHRLKHANGAWRWIAIRGKAVNYSEDGAPLRMVGTIRDVHQQVLDRRELEAAKDRSEAAFRAKANLLTIMSHELRTPLNGIIGMNDLLLDTDLDEEQRDFLGTAQQSAHRLFSLISDLLDYARLDNNQNPLNPAPFLLADLVDDVLANHGETAMAKQLEFGAVIDPELPAIVRGDFQRIGQIISQLVRNAIQFTRSGHVLVRLAPGDPRPEPELSLRIEVEDTGDGIPDEDRERVFDLFSSADLDSRQPIAGMGLGLSTCRLLARAMGGDCTCSSTVGVGSTFSAEIVVERRPGDAANSLQREAIADQVVLVAAHDELVRACLCNAIRGIGGRAIAAATREQALAILETENQPLDAVLVDRRLPGSDRLYTVAAQLPHREGMRVCEVLPCDRLSENSFGAATGLVLLPARRRQILDALTGADPCLLPTPRAVDEDDAPKVLVVEDDAINREVCCTMLRRLGYRNDGVANGREAVHAVLHERYDFVLMDLVMPVMDGIRATSTICDLVPEDRRPVIIALSASTSAIDRDLCRSAGMADFLDKPLYKDDLGETLGRWNRERHQRDDGGAGDG